MNATIGICNECGRNYEPTSPRIGFFCEQPVTVEVKDKDKTVKVTKPCKGVVIRHENIMERISGI